ncbi:MAG: hypothetical protein O2955_19960 [Planctomycetota bacterium]|nr:hypothetical protein [Planctomycetota bacterium]MDA1214789.1 hypothetical protein [Planctomycetota bacterium]
MQALGLLPPYSADDVHRAYREQAKLVHPDAGGNQEQFVALHDLYDRALKFVTFHESRRAWLGERVERYMDRQRLIEEVEERGGSCRLRTSNSYLDDYGPDFSEMLCELETVSLTGPEIDDAALMVLSGNSAAQEIRLLDLSGSRVTDAGLATLANLQPEALDLRNTAISNAGLRRLDWVTRLDWLHVGQTRVGFWGRWRLSRRSPRLDIVTEMHVKPPDFDSVTYRHWKLTQRMLQSPG